MITQVINFPANLDLLKECGHRNCPKLTDNKRLSKSGKVIYRCEEHENDGTEIKGEVLNPDAFFTLND